MPSRRRGRRTMVARPFDYDFRGVLPRPEPARIIIRPHTEVFSLRRTKESTSGHRNRSRQGGALMIRLPRL